MNVGYDSASMTVLQKEMQIARGGMYRYFKSKDDLFVAVMDKFFFGVIRHFQPKFSDASTLLERIEHDYKSRKELSKYLDEIVDRQFVFLNYTALIIQGAKHYPNFMPIMKRIGEADFKSWVNAIEVSIRKGEVRGDIDVRVMARVFMKAAGFDGPEDNNKNFARAAESSKQSMIYLYSLIAAK